MTIGYLDLEDIEDFFRLFDKTEERASTPIAIGKVTTFSNDGQKLKIDLFITTRVTYPEDGDTIIRHFKNMGSCLIPFEALKNGRRGEKEEYEDRKKAMDAIIKEVDTLRNNLTMKFEGKGFPVLKGVWTV